jgi:hypothetical protein
MARLTLARKIAAITLLVWEEGGTFRFQIVGVLWRRVPVYLWGTNPSGGCRILETLDFEGKYPSDKSGPCLKHASLRSHPMPSRTIEESHRPRVSDRTMHCRFSSGQSSGWLFQTTMGAATTAKWNHHKEEERLLRLARGDEPKPSAWGRPLAE